MSTHRSTWSTTTVSQLGNPAYDPAFGPDFEIAFALGEPEGLAALLRSQLSDPPQGQQVLDAVVVYPTDLGGAAAALRDSGPQAPQLWSVAGFPTGRHHTLIKASEARLAVEEGAAGIVLVLDPAAAADPNRAIMEVAAVSEAVTANVPLVALWPRGDVPEQVCRAAQMAGARAVLPATAAC